jgi:hypothetical protein
MYAGGKELERMINGKVTAQTAIVKDTRTGLVVGKRTLYQKEAHEPNSTLKFSLVDWGIDSLEITRFWLAINLAYSDAQFVIHYDLLGKLIEIETNDAKSADLLKGPVFKDELLMFAAHCIKSSTILNHIRIEPKDKTASLKTILRLLKGDHQKLVKQFILQLRKAGHDWPELKAIEKSATAQDK